MEKRLTTIEENERQLNRRLKTIEEVQDRILTQTGQIHTALMGTDYDKSSTNGNGGGLVKRLSRIEEKVSRFDSWKVKVSTTSAIVWTITGATLTALWTIFIKHWDKISLN